MLKEEKEEKDYSIDELLRLEDSKPKENSHATHTQQCVKQRFNEEHHKEEEIMLS